MSDLEFPVPTDDEIRAKMRNATPEDLQRELDNAAQFRTPEGQAWIRRTTAEREQRQAQADAEAEVRRAQAYGDRIVNEGDIAKTQDGTLYFCVRYSTRTGEPGDLYWQVPGSDYDQHVEDAPFKPEDLPLTWHKLVPADGAD